MLFFFLACALLLLLIFQLAKSPPASGPPEYFPPDMTRKKGPQKAAKFKLIKVQKQRKTDDVRRGFDVQQYGADRAGRSAADHFTAVKRESYVKAGSAAGGRIY